MDFADLGPLEHAALRALAHAELIGAPLTVASLWRSLPGYQTSLPNVRAALEDGAPLRAFVARDKDHFALADRTELLRRMARRQGWSDGRWRQLGTSLRGLGKLPWVEAVGITGTMAWGLLDEESSACELVIIAEGGRVPLARAAVRAWRKASGRRDVLRIAAVLDADALAMEDAGATAAWWLLAVRPVVNEEAFSRLWSANQWARQRFPNFDVGGTGGLPEFFLGARVDGKLAAARRAVVAESDDGVLLGSAGRRDAGWEQTLLGVVGGRKVAQACREEWVTRQGADVLRGTGLGDGDERVQARMQQLAGWAFEDEAKTASTEAAAESKAAPGPKAPAVPASKRTRGPKKQRTTRERTPRARSAAAPEGGGSRR